MNILIICQYYPPEPFRIGDICQALNAKGHSITVLAGIPNYPSGSFYSGYIPWKISKENSSGITVIRVPIIRRGRNSPILLILNYISFALAAAIYAGVLAMRPFKRFQSVLVYQLSPITMALPALIYAKIAKVHFAMYVADLWPESLDAMNPKLYKLLKLPLERFVKGIYRNCNKILVSSMGFIPSVKLRLGNRKTIIELLPQYSESIYTKYNKEYAQKRLGISLPYGFNIVFSGNIGFAQGLTQIIQALAVVRESISVNLIIIGDGRAAPTLKKEILARGVSDHVLMIGRKTPQEVALYLSLCDAAYISLQSIPALELTLPAKMQSYLACGIPIVGSIGGEGKRVIEQSGAGIVVMPGDIDALVAAIIKLAGTSQEELENMSRNGIKYSLENYSEQQFIKILERALVCD